MTVIRWFIWLRRRSVQPREPVPVPGRRRHHRSFRQADQRRDQVQAARLSGPQLNAQIPAYSREVAPASRCTSGEALRLPLPGRIAPCSPAGRVCTARAQAQPGGNAPAGLGSPAVPQPGGAGYADAGSPVSAAGRRSASRAARRAAAEGIRRLRPARAAVSGRPMIAIELLTAHPGNVRRMSAWTRSSSTPSPSSAS